MADKWYERSKYNICTDFLVPMLFDKKEDIITNSYENCYYYDLNYPWVEGKIILIYNSDIHENDYVKLYKKLINNKNFHSFFTYFDNGNKEKYVFTIPPNRKRDYKLILEGKYSQLSELYKQRILSFWGLTSNSRLGGILYKTHYQQEDNDFKLNQKGELLNSPSSCVIKEYSELNIEDKQKGTLVIPVSLNCLLYMNNNR